GKWPVGYTEAEEIESRGRRGALGGGRGGGGGERLIDQREQSRRQVDQIRLAVVALVWMAVNGAWTAVTSTMPLAVTERPPAAELKLVARSCASSTAIWCSRFRTALTKVEGSGSGSKAMLGCSFQFPVSSG